MRGDRAALKSLQVEHNQRRAVVSAALGEEIYVERW